MLCGSLNRSKSGTLELKTEIVLADYGDDNINCVRIRNAKFLSLPEAFFVPEIAAKGITEIKKNVFSHNEKIANKNVLYIQRTFHVSIKILFH